MHLLGSEGGIAAMFLSAMLYSVLPTRSYMKNVNLHQPNGP